MKITEEYIRNIQGAIAYNSSSTFAYAENRLLDMLKSIDAGEGLLIQPANISIRTLAEFKVWKKGIAWLECFNTDELLKKIR